MLTLTGIVASTGIAIGPLHHVRSSSLAAAKIPRQVADVQAEIDRLETARRLASDELSKLAETTTAEAGAAVAAIFTAHRQILDDPSLVAAIQELILGKAVNVEYAAAQAGESFVQLFKASADPLMQARAVDVEDVIARLIRILSPIIDESFPPTPVILIANELTPSDTVRIDPKNVLALASVQGSVSSHTAILARSLGIPALIGLAGLTAETDGHPAIVDGHDGILYIDPDPATWERLATRQKADLAKNQLLSQYIHQPNITRDGTHIGLHANAESLSGVAAAIASDAEGIGLFRSEFVYLARSDYPSEQELADTYRRVLQEMAPKRVIIRTLDIGSDKRASYFALPQENNPALGLRGIRLSLERPELFRTQLRALLRASIFGKLAIMFPMVGSVTEVSKACELLAEVKSELTDAGIAYSASIPVGIMIETPAAVMLSAELAKHVAFFSVGTNDLSQYVMAIDRGNQQVSKYDDPEHTAVLKMIELATKAAHDAGIWIGICGDLAADLSLTETFLQMGIDELSVAPSELLRVRQQLRSLAL